MTVLLALLLASGPVYLSADGGELLVLDVERAAILLPGSGDEAARVVHVDGGSWVSTDQRIREGQKHAELVGRNQYLEAHASDMPTAWVGAALGVGAVLGVVVTLVAVGVVKPH